jgi:hypothetical protein
MKKANMGEGLEVPVQFNITLADEKGLLALHRELKFSDAGVPVAATARLVFKHGLNRMTRPTKKANKNES